MPEKETWQVSDNAAIVYEQKLVPALFGEWPPRIADVIGINTRDNVLDVGCGTGVLARELATRVGPDGSVTGIDINEGMLTVAERIRPEISWKHGDVDELPFEDSIFDVVVSQFALMYFPDREHALTEMWRVLKPGGRLAVAVWGDFNQSTGYVTLAEIAQARTGSAAAELLRSPFVLGDKRELTEIFGAAGIEAIDIESLEGTARFPSIDEFVESEVKGSPLDDILDAQSYQLLLDEARRGLKFCVNGCGEVVFPMPAHIVAAGK